MCSSVFRSAASGLTKEKVGDGACKQTRRYSRSHEGNLARIACTPILIRSLVTFLLVRPSIVAAFATFVKGWWIDFGGDLPLVSNRQGQASRQVQENQVRA